MGKTRSYALATALLFGSLLALAWFRAALDWPPLAWLVEPLCHQRPERCFMIDGQPMALCVRCVGIYLGLVLGGGAWLFKPGLPGWSFAALVLALGLNVLNWLLESRLGPGGLPPFRFIAGLALGMAMAGFVLPRIAPTCE